MYRQESEDTKVIKDKMAVASTRPGNHAETSGVSWNFARHGMLLQK